MKLILHFILVFSIFGSIITAVSATYFFSKEKIMEAMIYAYADIGVQVDPVDLLFVARIVRRFAWEWHFWLGLIVIGSSIVFFIYSYLKRSKKMDLHMLFGVQIVFLFLSGIILQYRFLDIVSSDIVSVVRDAHRFGSYIFMLTIGWHLISVFKLKKGKV